MGSQFSKCSRCGGSNFETGSIHSDSKIVFSPASSKFWTLKGGLKVSAEVCSDCGNLQMTVDTRELAELTNRT